MTRKRVTEFGVAAPHDVPIYPQRIRQHCQALRDRRDRDGCFLNEPATA
jgi:hypothetical protein